MQTETRRKGIHTNSRRGCTTHRSMMVETVVTKRGDCYRRTMVEDFISLVLFIYESVNQSTHPTHVTKSLQLARHELILAQANESVTLAKDIRTPFASLDCLEPARTTGFTMASDWGFCPLLRLSSRTAQRQEIDIYLVLMFEVKLLLSWLGSGCVLVSNRRSR